MANLKNLSKSKYLYGLQCSKLLWIAVNQPWRMPPADAKTQYLFEQGHLIGRLAQRLYPEGLNLHTSNIRENIEVTRTALSLRKPLFEAGFSYNRLYCRIDILNPAGEGNWDIIEVKSAQEFKDIHLHDLAFQLYCCKRAGIKIERCNIMHLTKSSSQQGENKLDQLFVTEDVTESLDEYSYGLEKRTAKMFSIIASGSCPRVSAGRQCRTPYLCRLRDGCLERLPIYIPFRPP